MGTSSGTEILLVLSLFAATNEQHVGGCRHSFPRTLLREKHSSSPEAVTISRYKNVNDQRESFNQLRIIPAKKCGFSLLMPPTTSPVVKHYRKSSSQMKFRLKTVLVFMEPASNFPNLHVLA